MPSVSDSVGMSAETTYDAMKIFHKYKQVNPITGIKNPTIVNGSWGYQLHLKRLILLIIDLENQLDHLLEMIVLLIK